MTDEFPQPDSKEAVLIVEGLQGEATRVRLRLRQSGKAERSGELELGWRPPAAEKSLLAMAREARRTGSLWVEGFAVGAVLADAFAAEPACAELWRELEDALAPSAIAGCQRLVLAVDPSHAAAELPFEALLVKGEPPFLDGRRELVRTWRREPAKGALVRDESAAALRVLVLLGDPIQHWAKGHIDQALTSSAADEVRATLRAIAEALAAIAGLEAIAVAPGWNGDSLAIANHPVGKLAELRAKLRSDFDAVVFVGHSDAVFEGPVAQHRPATGLCFLIDGKRELLSFADLRAELRRPRLLVLHSCWTDPGALRELAFAADHVVAWGAKIDAGSCRIATQQLFTALAASPPAALGDALRIARHTLFCGFAHASGRAWLLTHYARDRHVEAFVDAGNSAFAVYRDSASGRLLRLPAALARYADAAQVLEDLYVELDIEPGRDAESAALQRLIEAGRRGPQPLRTWIEDPLAPRHFVLCGEPGSGKSTLLRHLAAQLLAKGWLAAYVPIQALLDLDIKRVDELAKLSARFDEFAFLAESRIRRALASGRFVLLLDGLDEVDDRGVAESRITLIARQIRAAPFVIAARTDGLLRIHDEIGIARICELEAARQRDLVRRWFETLLKKPARRAELSWLFAQGRGADDRLAAACAAVFEEFERRRALTIVCRNPLALTLCILRIAALGPKELPATRYGILSWLADFLLVARHRDDSPFDEAETPRELLAELALFLLERGVAQCALIRGASRFSPLGDQFLAALPRSLREARLQGPPEERGESWQVADPRAWCISRRPSAASRTLADRLRSTGLLEPIDDVGDAPAAALRFPIQSLADFLAAAALRARFEHDLPALLRWLKERREVVLANLGRWSETLALCASWQGERAKDWLLGLAEIDPKLGLRALGRADHPPLESIVALLGRGKPHEKEAFWDGFAASFGIDSREDAERALELIERAAPSLRSGTDRCLMEEEAIAAAERFGLAQAAVQRVQRVVRASPEGRTLDVELFAKQPVSGEPLWKRIPYVVDGEDRSFWMMAVPVTVAMYAAFDPQHRFLWRGRERSVQEAVPFKVEHFQDGANDALSTAHPAIVCWFEALAFTRWLNAVWLPRVAELTGVAVPKGWKFRLPTEHEWEWACRAGTATKFWCGNELLKSCAWFGKRYKGAPHPAGLLAANPWGLRDMHGNAWDWCLDAWGDKEEPAGRVVGRGSDRVLRGGSFWSNADHCRSAFRYGIEPVFRGNLDDYEYVLVGFRPVLAAPLPSSVGLVEDR
jgi:hypothetical protein